MQNPEKKHDRSEEAMKRKRAYSSAYSRSHYSNVNLSLTPANKAKMDEVRKFCKICKISLVQFLVDAAVEKILRTTPEELGFTDDSEEIE